jgi:hypothetical protein
VGLNAYSAGCANVGCPDCTHCSQAGPSHAGCKRCSAYAQGAPGPSPAPLDCTAAFAGGTPRTYGHCQALAPGDADVRLFWTLDRAGGAIDALLQCAGAGAGWCAWGVPASPGRMVGASVVVLRACPSCATGAPELRARPVAGVAPRARGARRRARAARASEPPASLAWRSRGHCCVARTWCTGAA